jgi:transmembrane sensor
MKNKDTKEEEATKYWLHYFRRNDVPELTAEELEQQSEYMYRALMQVPDLQYLKARRINYPLISVAAAVLMIVAVALFYFNSSQKVESDQQAKLVHNIAVPGRDAATLVLAGGQRIELSSISNGKIAEQTGVDIFKATQNKLVYKASESKVSGTKATTDQINTVLTANGEQYSVDLPDGTKVWLNAASSIKFPTTFASKANRTVELTGEAYFEVAKDKAHPFIVKTDKQEIKVLGTHFNVSSYPDEQFTKTTLFEGSVKVVSKTDAGSIATLKPGQQAQVSSKTLKVKEVDLTEGMAWKNGDFNFENEEFSSILNQVSRWYNVEIIDNKKHEGLKLTGMVSRSKSLSTVLNSLEGTADVKFRIEGRKVTVID